MGQPTINFQNSGSVTKVARIKKFVVDIERVEYDKLSVSSFK